MRTEKEEDEKEEEASIYVISVTVFVRFCPICPFLSALFLSVLEIQGTERTKTDTKHDPPPPSLVS